MPEGINPCWIEIDRIIEELLKNDGNMDVEVCTRPLCDCVNCEKC